MSTNFHITADDQQQQHRRRLLEQKAQIEAELATLPQPSQPSVVPSSANYDRQASRRSYSLAGTAMRRTVSSGRGNDAVRMSGSLSQPCPAPAMASSASRGASSANLSMSLADTGRVPPRLQSADCRRDPSAIDLWATRRDDPLNAYTLPNHGSLRCTPTQHTIPELAQVVEMDLGEDPMAYFARTDGTSGAMPTLSVMSSPIDIPTSSEWHNSYPRLSMSSRPGLTFGITTPATPNSATLTTATTQTMSRQSSLSNEVILGPFDMMNVHSNTSCFTDNNSADETQFHSGIPFPSYPKLQSSNEEQDLLLMGTGGASHDSHISISFENDGALAPFTSSTVEDMKRSESKESSVSSSSSKSRAAAQLQRLNQLAARPIAPKAGCDEDSLSRKGSLHMVRINSRDGKEEKVVAISKTIYQRPKHERVYCDLCSECPEGFRGAHELGRHQDRQHKDTVTKYVCIQPADGVINPQYQPVNSLAKCKACSQDKKYGAYYNAAAHLRRAHFRPKSRGRGKHTKVDEKSEKRGGKGGGSWPPMAELKRWMKRVCEVVSDHQASQVDTDDEEDDDCGSNEFDDELMPQMSSGSVGQAEFDGPYVYTNEATMVDPYPTPTPTFENQGFSNVQFEHQSIDMQPNPSQSFAESQFMSMHDSIPYIDGFPQSFEDQSLGPDLSYHLQYNM